MFQHAVLFGAAAGVELDVVLNKTTKLLHESMCRSIMRTISVRQPEEFCLKSI